MKNKKISITINILVMLLICNLYLATIGIYNYRTSPAVLIGALITGVLSLCYFYQKKSIYKCNWQLYLVICIGIFYLISGIVYKSPAYLVFGFVFIVQLPFYYTMVRWKNNDDLIHKFCIWSTIFLCLILIVTLTCCRWKGGQYSGIFNNPNLWGEILAAALIPLLYLFERTKKNKIKFFIIVVIAICITNIILTASRTAMLACVTILIVYCIYIVPRTKKLLKKLICATLIICITCSITYLGLRYITPDETDALIELGLTTEEQDNENRDLMETLEGRYLKGIADNGSFSSGRTLIWKEYIKELSILGNDPEPLVIANGNNINKQNAHNAFIQIGYEAGIIAMGMMLLLVINIAYLLIRKIITKRLTLLDFFEVSGFGIAIIYMMLSSEYSPYNSFGVLVFWLFTMPMILQKDIEADIEKIKVK